MQAQEAMGEQATGQESPTLRLDEVRRGLLSGSCAAARIRRPM
jgi:hypothetical protein